jgi:DNA helicase MCM8
MFGAKLGLSSMMAAGLGNTVADVVGINISHTIEVRTQSLSTAAMLSRFDLIFVLLDRPDEIMDQALSEHIMALHTLRVA